MRLFKSISTLTLAVFLSFAGSLSAQQQTVTIHPEKPQPGETVTITYHPDSPDAKITEPDSLKIIFSYKPYLFGLADEVAMKKNNEGWSTSFKLAKQTPFVRFYFKSGEITDKNTEDRQYEFMAYQNGRPVKDAYLRKASRVDNLYKEASEQFINDKKAHLYAKALAAYPDYFDAKMLWYTFLLSQPFVDSTAIKDKAYAAIHQKLMTNPGSWQVVNDVQRAYTQIGEKAKGDSIKQAMIDKYPKSDIAMYDLYYRAMDEEDKDKQADMLKTFVNAEFEQSYRNKYNMRRAYRQLFEYYAEQGSVEKMKAVAEKWLQPNPRVMDDPIMSDDLNSVALVITQNTNEHDWALEYAQKSLQLSDKEQTTNMKMISENGIRYISRSDDSKKAEQLNNRKSNILSTLGLIYTNKGDYQKAEQILTEAKNLSDGSSPQKYLANLYQQTDRAESAFDIYWKLLLEEPLDEELRANLKKSYIAYHGSEEGFEEKTAEFEAAWREKTVAEFKEEMLDKEPPSMATVTNLQGGPLDPSSMKNKVVVIDFWATWCGPCMSAFPYLQAVYEKYEDHPDVKFIVLNSAWSNSIEDAVKWTKDGDYAENEYTFPLYYDKNSKVTTAFGVRGIPTTFVLGRDGNIKFKHVGYYGAVMEKELALRIDMLLDDAATAMK